MKQISNMFATFPNTCVIISITKVLLSLVFLYIHSQIGHHIPISLKGLCTLIVCVVYGVFNIGRIEIYRRICRNCNALCQLFFGAGIHCRCDSYCRTDIASLKEALYCIDTRGYRLIVFVCVGKQPFGLSVLLNI